MSPMLGVLIQHSNPYFTLLELMNSKMNFEKIFFVPSLRQVGLDWALMSFSEWRLLILFVQIIERKICVCKIVKKKDCF